MDAGKKRFFEIITPSYNFEVPDYQRNYSWTRGELEDLWRDLHTVIEADKPHFYGTVLFREKSVGTYDIIDGQQRLATMQILLNELAKKWEEYEEGEGQGIRDTYIAPTDGYKLTLMGDDKRFFKERILGGLDWDEDTSLDDDTPSKTRLLKAKGFFEEKFEDKEEELIDDGDPSEFTDYLDDLKSKIDELELMIYSVNSEAEAVRIFEVVNDRGRQLTDLERTKSFLMHQLYLSIPDSEEEELEERLETVRNRFNDIYQFVDKSGRERGRSLDEDDIQRYHFIIWDNQWTRSRNPRYQNHLTNLKEKFRAMEDGDEKVQEVMEYTQELRSSFNAIYNIQSLSTDDYKVETRLKRLLTLGTLGNFYPLLIGSWIKYNDGTYSPEEYAGLLDRVETFIFRVYSATQRTTRTGRRKFYDLSRDIHLNDLTPDGAVEEINNHINYYCDDEKLLDDLQDNDVFNHYGSNRKDDLRYLLYFYELDLEEDEENLNLDFEDTVKNSHEEHTITIEHIWPNDPSELDQSDEEVATVHDPNKHRLGNLALMTWSWNSGEQNQPFGSKKPTYLDSNIRMLNEVADPEKRSEWGSSKWGEDEWGVDQIEIREEKITDFILERWPDPQSAEPKSLLEAEVH